jgi:hypothetical protein
VYTTRLGPVQVPGHVADVQRSAGYSSWNRASLIGVETKRRRLVWVTDSRSRFVFHRSSEQFHARLFQRVMGLASCAQASSSSPICAQRVLSTMPMTTAAVRRSSCSKKSPSRISRLIHWPSIGNGSMISPVLPCGKTTIAARAVDLSGRGYVTEYCLSRNCFGRFRSASARYVSSLDL